MNVEQAGIVLRERSLLEVMDLSLRFVFGLAPRTYAKLAFWLLAPALALTFLLRWYFELDWFWTWLLAIALGGLLQGAFTIAAGQLMFSDGAPTRQLLWEFRLRLVPYAVTLLLSRTLIVLAGLLIVTLPFAWMRLLYVHEAALLEKAWPWEAMRRSSRFVSHHATNAFGALLAFLAGTALAVIVGELLGQGVVSFVLQSGNPFGTLLDGGSPYAVAGYFASVPFVATARFLTYIDTRSRRDGWDIQIRFIAIEAREQERLA